VSDPTDLGTPTSPLIAALLARSGGTPTLPPNSRYLGLPTRTWTGPDGTPIVYLSRRLVPQASSFASVETYMMSSGERLDQVAGAKYGDPLLAWRLADANGALDPAELEHRGQRIRIVLPEGVPGNSGA
jgi:hypothetical protein